MQKVLIITYYWPPAGGPAVQRWLKFVKYLSEFGITPIVYIPKNPHYPIVDNSFVDEIPKGIRIYKNFIFEPYNFANIFSKKKTKQISAGIIQNNNQSFTEKTMLWIRGNLFIPDARKYWLKPSVSFLSNIIDKENIDTVITTGPPHSVHLIGERLKRDINIRWFADFRDPWTSIGYHKKLKLTKISQRKHKRLEHLVLNNADKIIVTSTTTKKEFAKITTRPIVVITNGYDNYNEDCVTLDANFTISHIGSMLTGRNPENLWRVIAEIIEENKAFKKALQLQFIGVISTDILETIHSCGLGLYVNLVGYVPHQEAILYQRRSQLLLLAEINSEETKGIIPGKLFEYIAAKRPILGIGPKSWEVKTIIEETKSGATFNYKDYYELKKVLLKWFKQYQKQKLNVLPVDIKAYSRKELTKKLAINLQWE